MSKARIAYIQDLLSGRGSGHFVAAELREFWARGADVWAVAKKVDPRFFGEFSGGCSFRDRVCSSASLFPRMLEIVEDIKPSYLHTHDATDCATCTIKVSEALDIPFGFTCHSRDLWQVGNRLEPEYLRVLAGHELCLTCAAVGKRQADYLIWCGVPENKIVVVPSYVKLLASVCPSSSSDWQTLPRPRMLRKLVMLAPSTLKSEVVVATDAVRLLQLRGYQVSLRFVGLANIQSPFSEELEKFTHAFPFVSIGPLCAAQDLLEELTNADVLIVPSISLSKSEELNSLICVAMLLGRPVIATDVGGVTDLIIHGKTGLIARTGDAVSLASSVIELDALLADSQAGEDLLSEAQKHARQFDIGSVVDKLSAHLGPLLGFGDDDSESYVLGDPALEDEVEEMNEPGDIVLTEVFQPSQLMVRSLRMVSSACADFPESGLMAAMDSVSVLYTSASAVGESKLSVIIPVLPGEEDWAIELIHASAFLDNALELIVSAAAEANCISLKAAMASCSGRKGQSLIISPDNSSAAQLLNAGSVAASAEWLLFAEPYTAPCFGELPELLKAIGEISQPFLFGDAKCFSSSAISPVRLIELDMPLTETSGGDVYYESDLSAESKGPKDQARYEKAVESPLKLLGVDYGLRGPAYLVRRDFFYEIGGFDAALSCTLHYNLAIRAALRTELCHAELALIFVSENYHPWNVELPAQFKLQWLEELIFNHALIATSPAAGVTLLREQLDYQTIAIGRLIEGGVSRSSIETLMLGWWSELVQVGAKAHAQYLSQQYSGLVFRLDRERAVSQLEL